MIGRRHELARLQSDFYRDNYRKMLIALILSILVMLLLISAIIYIVLKQPDTKYYASTTNGQIIQMIPRS
jgi:intracellular multiplication protein IcmL